MALLIKDILNHFFPSGTIFNPKPGGNLDRLYSGICDSIDSLIIDCKKIIAVRNPFLTDMLDDLEKDHGLIDDSNLSEEERRRFLNVFAYKKNGKGDLSLLQTRLRDAGFSNVYVTENSPARDPNEVLGGEYRIYLASENAYLGSEDAFIGESSASILVDGVNDKKYTLPSDERLNYVFFVGSQSTGWVLIHDQNMELQDLEYWVAGSGSIVSKDKTYYNSPIQSLKISNNGNTEEQEYFQIKDSCAPVSAFIFYDLDQDAENEEENGYEYGGTLVYSGHKIKNISNINILSDPTMDIAGTINYGSENVATLSKDNDCYDGRYSLKVLYNGMSYPAAYCKQRLVTGTKYRAVGYVKTYNCYPWISIGDNGDPGVLLFSSANEGYWEKFEFYFECTSSKNLLKLGCDADSSGEYVLYDNVLVQPLNDDYSFVKYDEYNHIKDGNCNDSYGIYDDILSQYIHWFPVYSALLSKVPTGITGNLLRCTYNGTANPGVRSYCTSPNKIYRLTGKIALSDISNTAYIKSNTTTKYIYDPTDTNLNEFEVFFTSEGSYVDFSFDGSSDDFMSLDDLYLEDLSNINKYGVNNIDKIGRNIIYDYAIETPDECEIKCISDYDISSCFTVSFWIKPSEDSEIISSDSEISISISSSKITFKTIESVDDVLFNEWNHVLISYSSVYTTEEYNVKMFLNGIDQQIEDDISVSSFFDESFIISNTQIHSLSFYGKFFTDEECIKEYSNGISIFYGGLVKHELTKGIKNLTGDFVVDNSKIIETKVFDPSNYNNGESKIGTLTLTGSGDEPIINVFEFSNTKSISFNSGKYFESEDSSFFDIDETDTVNCYIIRSIFYNENCEVISKYEDSNNYWKIYIEDSIVYFKLVKSSNIICYFQSNDVSSNYNNEYLFVDILVDLENKKYGIYINGKDETDTCIFGSDSSPFSNNGLVSVGKNTVSNVCFISFSCGKNIFED